MTELLRTHTYHLSRYQTYVTIYHRDSNRIAVLDKLRGILRLNFGLQSMCYGSYSKLASSYYPSNYPLNNDYYEQS